MLIHTSFSCRLFNILLVIAMTSHIHYNTIKQRLRSAAAQHLHLIQDFLRVSDIITIDEVLYSPFDLRANFKILSSLSSTASGIGDFM